MLLAESLGAVLLLVAAVAVAVAVPVAVPVAVMWNTSDPLLPSCSTLT